MYGTKDVCNTYSYITTLTRHCCSVFQQTDKNNKASPINCSINLQFQYLLTHKLQTNKMCNTFNLTMISVTNIGSNF
jgi:hypothetical protein